MVNEKDKDLESCKTGDDVKNYFREKVEEINENTGLIHIRTLCKNCLVKMQGIENISFSTDVDVSQKPTVDSILNMLVEAKNTEDIVIFGCTLYKIVYSIKLLANATYGEACKTE